MSRHSKRTSLWRRDAPAEDTASATTTATADVRPPAQPAPSAREIVRPEPGAPLPVRSTDAERPRVQGLSATLELRRRQVASTDPTLSDPPPAAESAALEALQPVLGELTEVLSRTSAGLEGFLTGLVCTSSGTPVVHLGMDEGNARRLAATTSEIHRLVAHGDGSVNVMVMSLENGQTHAGAATTVSPRLLLCLSAHDTSIGLLLHAVQQGVKEIDSLLTSSSEPIQ